MTQLLTAAQAAQRLSLSIKTLNRLRRAGEIHFVALTDRKFAYREQDCDNFIESRIRKVVQPCPSSKKRIRQSRPSQQGNIISFTTKMLEKSKLSQRRAI